MKTSVAAQPYFSLRALLPALAAIIMGSFMAILDSTIVNVALPTLGHVFSVDLASLQWVITGYMLAQAAVIPLAGWLSDRYTARRMYLIALALFTIGSALCATSANAQFLIIWRVVQGFGGGIVMPTGMAMVFRMAPSHKRGTLMSVFGIALLLGPTLGPVLSGWLLQYADWRLIFLINVPVGIVAVLVGLRALPKPVGQHAAVPLDVPGIFLAPVAFASLTYGISESATAGWTGLSTIIGVSLGVVAFVLFVARELSASHPLLELRVFRKPDFARGTLVQWVSFTGLFGTMFLVPLFLQQVRGYDTLDTGLYMLPGAVGSGLLMQFSGRLFDRVGVKIPATAGLILCSCSMLLFSRMSPSTTGSDLILPMVLQGSGLGLFGMPLNAYLLSTVPSDLVSRVTSLLSACQNLVGSLAIATFATILEARMANVSANAGPGFAPANLATAFASVYQIALVAVVIGLALVLTLSRHPGGREGYQHLERVGGRVADTPAAPWL